MSVRSRPIRVLEIRSVRGTGGGPEKTILLSAQRADPRRVQTTVCYIRDDRDHVFGIDTRAAALKVDYVEVRERHSFDPSAWTALRRIVREREIDIVHAHEYKTDLLAYWLARVEPVIPLSTVHGWSGHTWRERGVYYPADRLVLTTFPKVIAVSREIRRTLIRAGARRDRTVTILNAIDHRAFRRDKSREAACRSSRGLGAHETIIGTVGRLEPGKGLEMLIDVVGTIARDRPDVRLVIAGDGSLRPALARQAETVLPGRVVFLGHHADVIGVHHTFDLFVHPSDHEGTPNAVLEAMALETPLVATAAGGTADLAPDGSHALIVPCRTPHALERAIVSTLDDRAAATRRAAMARRRVEEHLSFDARMVAVEAIYEELAARRTGMAPAQRVDVA
jgi:glycosyltransferase involved in cell wall biosynthesis